MGIISKYFGPMILSFQHMMRDVFLFLITFCVIMIAFASGVSYIFNMASGNLHTYSRVAAVSVSNEITNELCYDDKKALELADGRRAASTKTRQMVPPLMDFGLQRLSFFTARDGWTRLACLLAG